MSNDATDQDTTKGGRTITVNLATRLVVLAEAEAQYRCLTLSDIIESALWDRYGDEAVFSEVLTELRDERKQKQEGQGEDTE